MNNDMLRKCIISIEYMHNNNNNIKPFKSIYPFSRLYDLMIIIIKNIKQTLQT